VWSFGLTVLAMAVGGPGWKFGFDAPRSLERYRTGKLASKLGALPDPIASVLERCFRQEPSSRWASLAEAAEALCAAHRELFGRDLDRARPAPVVLSAPPPSFGRRLSTGASWRPAAEWLAFALQAAGQDARGGLEGAPASEHRSLLARAIADLGKLDRAETILRELADAGARELAGPLAAVRFERAIVHEFAGDHAGASASLDRSIEGLRGARAEDLDEPGQDLLAAAIDYRGLVDLAASRPEDALPRHEQAVAIRIAMGGRAPGSRFAGEMAASLLNRATASHALGRLRESLADIDDALALLEGAPAEVRESPFGLTCRARALLGRSSACRSLGDHAGALRAVDEALESAPALRDDEPALVAWLLRNRGMTLVSLGHARAAFGDYETAVGLLESAVVEQGRDELAADLGLARMNFAFALGRGGERGAAFEQFDKATVTLEDLVERAGRTDLENELARLCVNHAVVRIEAGEASRAVVLARRAVAIRERLVVEQGQAHREADLALALRHLGLALFEADEAEAAIEPLERAVRMLDGRVGAGDAAVAFSTLAQAQADLGRALARCARPSDSLCALERAAAGFEALLATGGSQEVAPFLASVRLQRASLLGALEGPAAARRALEELVGALEAANEFPGGLGARDDLVVEALEQRRVLDEQARDRAGVRAGLEAILRVLARTGADGADAGRALVLARRCVAAAMQVGGEGDHEAARELTTRAIAALERALEGRGADECIGDLACARILRAVAGFNLGQVEQARTDARQGIAVLSVEAPRTGRRDLQQMLTWALSTLPVAPKG
jgi:tetratricopeptide (TPR) repeat protein